MATGFSFIRSQRGKYKLVSEGYIYKVDCVRGEKSYWVCHLPDCKGRCIQTAENKAMLTLKKIFLFILFLGKSLPVSVGEFLKYLSVTYVGQWSCRRVGWW